MNKMQNGVPVTTQTGAYNTYVGARYVPKITGEWDNTKNYEPLSIVINQGNSYTSAQYVPVGIPLQTNGPYWFLTGNFNGQIASIEQEIETLNNIVDSLTDDINNIMKPYSNYIFIGDSYAVPMEGARNVIWPNIAANHLGLNPSTYKTIGKNGMGFLRSENNVVSQWNSFYSSNKEFCDNAGNIILALGANDFTYNITGNINIIEQQLSKIKSDCPHATIHLFMVGNIFSKTPIAYEVQKIYALASSQTNVKYYENAYRCWHSDGSYQGDLIHPTAQGENQIGTMIANSLTFGYTYFNEVKMKISNTTGTVTGFVNQYSTPQDVKYNAAYNNVTDGAVCTTDVVPGMLQIYLSTYNYVCYMTSANYNLTFKTSSETASGLSFGFGYSN